jgi:mono/diheme cytochrome c family protein
MMRIVLSLLALLVVASAATAGFIYSGFYDVAATQPHTHIAYYVLHYAMRSVETRAQDIRVPDLQDGGRLERGRALFRQHCQQCHGGPGVPPDPVGRGLRPLPTNLAQDGGEWPPNEIYWVIRHGIRMSAMPGWEFRLAESELWDLTAFVKHLPQLTPAQYQAPLAVAMPPIVAPALPPHVPDPRKGKFLVDQYMCATCHSIPGIAGADHLVGPPLDGIARRSIIGGSLPNTPDNMVRWLLDPQRFRPQSAMPKLGIGESEARDIAAYLGTLKEAP